MVLGCVDCVLGVLDGALTGRVTVTVHATGVPVAPPLSVVKVEVLDVPIVVDESKSEESRPPRSLLESLPRSLPRSLPESLSSSPEPPWESSVSVSLRLVVLVESDGDGVGRLPKVADDVIVPSGVLLRAVDVPPDGAVTVTVIQNGSAPVVLAGVEKDDVIVCWPWSSDVVP